MKIQSGESFFHIEIYPLRRIPLRSWSFGDYNMNDKKNLWVKFSAERRGIRPVANKK
jgi:hypothetical protein